MPLVTRTNTCINPSSETAAFATAGAGSGTVSLDSTLFYVGTKSTKYVWASGTWGFQHVGSGSPQTVTPNTTYKISLYCYVQSGAMPGFAAADNNYANSVSFTTQPTSTGSWLRCSLTYTTGAAQTTLKVYGTVSAASTFNVDAILIEQGSTLGTYFDGSFVNANSRMYAWTAGANASTSTEKTYTPDIALVAKTDAPCPRVEVTLTNFTPTDNTINLWVMADGVRRAVRGARELVVNDSTVIIDYEVALNREVDFSIEITDGLNVGASVPTQSITVASDTWWIQDPLVPTSAIAVDSAADYPDNPALTAAALKQLEYAADISIIPIMGSSEPVAIGGDRLAASGVPWNMVTTAAQATTQLRNLLKQCTVVLIRPGTSGAADEVPGKAYMAVAKPVEKPVTVAWGGTMTQWELVGDTVAPPTLSIQIPVWTYQNVKDLFATYQAALDAHSGDTYLDVLKSPSGA